MVVVVTLDASECEDLTAACTGIGGLVEWLDALEGRPGLAELGERLEEAVLNVDAIDKCVGYADAGYQRNIVKITEHYEMVLVTWKPGQDTPIHDHTGSDCAFNIVAGESTETVYSLDEDGRAVTKEVRIYLPGTVCAADESDIHRVSNDTDVNLINLHVYTPPLTGFGIYDAA
jgi:cysteine dioxygenase